MEPEFGKGLRALVVDDEEVVREVVEELLLDVGFEVSFAVDLDSARSTWSPDRFDLTMIDKNLPGGSGIELARHIVESGAPQATMIMTGFSNVESAVEAVRLGVSDYLLKPFSSLQDVLARVERAVSVLALQRDNARLIEALEEKNKVLQGLVVRDPLTGMFNHAFFQDLLEREVQRATRHGLKLTVLLVDVDGFKQINDEIGHAEGDRLLTSMAGVLGSQNRSSDAAFFLQDNEVAARLGEDTFAVVLPETAKAGGAIKAERLRASAAAFDFSAAGLPAATVSVGVAECPGDAPDRAGLVSAAQLALDVAKNSGRNRTVSFTPALRTAGKGAALDEVERLTALDRSIESDAFLHHFQPIVRHGSAEIFAYESLVRPKHPLLPNPFVLFDTARRAGRVVPLGRVLRMGSVSALERLPEPTLMFLNVDPLELNDPQFMMVEEAVCGWAKRVVLEITESSEVTDQTLSRHRLRALRDLGFRIAVDDLGAGYSGLNSLAMIRPEFVKLDMELVRGATKDGPTARLVRHILEYAEGEGMLVVAEGVETAQDRAVVEDIGCHLMQGYHFARPAPDFIPAGTKLG